MSKLFEMIRKEEERQENNVELIASENFVSRDVLNALGSVLTNKYSEGYPGKRYYGGCQYVDEIESYCQKKWQEVFKTDYHVNVQPHSGSQANMAAYQAILNPGDTILSMGLDQGGHLSHGSPVNFSGKFYIVQHYGVNENGYLDYNQIYKIADRIRPKLILAGASSYSRAIDYDIFRKIADEVGAYFMADIAHPAGLIACGNLPSPFGAADIVTTTTHKTLRSARGGLIFCKPELAKKVDSAVFPGIQGGPMQNVIAAKAVGAEEALTRRYHYYIDCVQINASAMADEFIKGGFKVVTGGTDNHMFVVDLTETHPNITGKMVQDKLDEIGITLNKNCVPGETRKPTETSGIRIGTPAMTTKGWNDNKFRECARTIMDTINNM